MFAHVNNLTLHYQCAGKDKAQPVVFINSLGSDLRIWEGVLPFLEGYHLIGYDKRGHGLSDAPPAPYTLQDHASDLEALLDYLGVASAVLVGISVGGMIALELARSRPERVAALVLCDTGARIGTVESWNARIEAIRSQGLDEVALGVIERWFTPAFFQQRPAEARGYYNMLSRTPVEGYIGTCMALRDADLRPYISQVQQPSLVLCGEADPSTPPALSEELSRGLGARLELIPEAAHLPCIEQPQQVGQQIQVFLQELGYVAL